MIDLKEKYQKEVIPAMQKRFGYSNALAVPKIEKVVVNTGFGKLLGGKTGDEQKKALEAVEQDLSSIAGQKATLTKAKKSISGFKLRQGQSAGAKVTLRGERMYDFLRRLVAIVLPRSRDFQGLEPSSVDSKGNLTIGIREHIFFPEISPEKVRDNLGLEITVVTTAKTREEGLELFKLLGFPLKM